MAKSLLKINNKLLVGWVLFGLIPLFVYPQQKVEKRQLKRTISPTSHESPIIFHQKKSDNLLVSPTTQSIGAEAMWDLQFAWRPADSTDEIEGNATLAGAVWTGSEFWISSWTTDSLIRLDVNGSFLGIEQIPGIRNIRSLTWDGTNIYTASNGKKLRAIDPQSKQVVDSIQISGPETYRFVAYDSLANNGAGGFYVGNFGSAIYLIDTAGQKVDTIAFSTHGRNTIYGAVVDHQSPGGPFLWVFDQPEHPSYAVISQLKLPEGIYTGFSRDVQADLNTQEGAAGGIFIGENIIPGTFTLGGLLQNSLGEETLFGYDLDYMNWQYNAGITSLYFDQRYTIFPRDQAELTFRGEVFNTGNDSLGNLELDFEIKNDSGSQVFFSEKTYSDLGSYDNRIFQLGPWEPPYANHFEILATSSINPLTDQFTANDSISIPINISDSVYARDDGKILLGLSINTTASQHTIMGQSFTLKEPDYLTSITLTLVEPDSGMEVKMSVFGTDTITGRPDQDVFYGRSEGYVITGEDALKGVTLTLPMEDTPKLLPAGEFFVGANQPGGTSLSLGLTFEVFTPQKTWVRSPALSGGTWLNNETLPNNPIQLIYSLRPNLGPCFPTYMNAAIEITADSGAGNGTAIIMPNGGAGVYTYQWDDPFAQTTQMAVNLVGGTTYTCIVTDTNGCTIFVTSDTIPKNSVSIDQFQQIGLQYWQVYPNPSNNFFKVNLAFDQPTNYELQLLNINGTKVYHQSFKNKAIHKSLLDVSNFSAGLYVFKLKTPQGSMIKKLAITP